MVERRPVKAFVVGSNPTRGAMIFGRLQKRNGKWQLQYGNREYSPSEVKTKSPSYEIFESKEEALKFAKERNIQIEEIEE